VPDGGPLYCDATFASWHPRTDQGLLILVPTRLGVDSINPIYFTALREFFSLSHFVGVAGGRPNSSLFFVGWEGEFLPWV
jgi:cysteine protease ATG4